MPRVPLHFPSGEEFADSLARELCALLGMHAPDGSNNAADARVLGAAIAAVSERHDDAAGEMFVASAREMLDEWEGRLSLPVSPHYDIPTRRALATAARRSTGGNTLGAFNAALRAIDPTALLMRTRAEDCTTYPRGVYHFTVRLAAAVYDNPALRARVEALVKKMKRSSRGYEVVREDAFLTDDEDSLTDVDTDVLGE